MEPLVKQAISNIRHNHKTRYRKIPLWVLVKDIFGLGSTRAIELCYHFGFDAWEELK